LTETNDSMIIIKWLNLYIMGACLRILNKWNLFLWASCNFSGKSFCAPKRLPQSLFEAKVFASKNFSLEFKFNPYGVAPGFSWSYSNSTPPAGLPQVTLPLFTFKTLNPKEVFRQKCLPENVNSLRCQPGVLQETLINKYWLDTQE